MRSLDVAGVPGVVLAVASACTDDTVAEIDRVAASDPRVVRLVNPLPGRSRAINLALEHLVREASPCPVLFTDDDVHVPRQWVRTLSNHLRDTHAVTSRVEVVVPPGSDLAPFQRELLADTGDGLGDPPRTLIGASMGLAPHVIAAGFRFDERLGAGRLGFMEESLLHLMMTEAGLTSRFASELTVLHRVDPSRLSRAAWLRRAYRQGVCEGWVQRHWVQRDLLSARDAARLGRSLAMVARGAARARAGATLGTDELMHVRRVGALVSIAKEATKPAAYPCPRWYPGIES